MEHRLMLTDRFFLPLLLIGTLLLFSKAIYSQELLCNVSINANQVQSDKQIFDEMQQNISQYLNFTRFSNDQFEPHERIRCNLQIIVNQRNTVDDFSCKASLVVYRPTLNASYETIILNITDNNFDFKYAPMQQMQFVDNTYDTDLTALLNFYAYVILGFDYATFSAQGGKPYFTKAQEIVNLATSGSQISGWRASDNNQRSRYWLIENVTNAKYDEFHDAYYEYHRMGLDKMSGDPAQGRKAILGSLKKMQEINRQNPLIYINRIFLDTKREELPLIFSEAFSNDKKEFVEIMSKLDPSNQEEYQAVMTAN